MPKVLNKLDCNGLLSTWVQLPGHPWRCVSVAGPVPHDQAIAIAQELATQQELLEAGEARLRERHPNEIMLLDVGRPGGVWPESWPETDRRVLWVPAKRRKGGYTVVADYEIV